MPILLFLFTFKVLPSLKGRCSVHLYNFKIIYAIPYRERLLALPSHSRLGWKGFSGTDALTYSAHL